jgi:CheY-like chemotaxis protein
MDMHMPVMDGLEATQKILESGVKTPIVALTANIMSDALELYRASGISDTVGKPFTARELWKLLIKYFRNENNSALKQNLEPSAETDHDIKIEDMQKIFVSDHQKTYEKIIDALDAKDTKAAHRLIHSLRSNAGFIKEMRLQEASSAVELALANNSTDFGVIRGQLDTVKTELGAVLEKLAHLL